MGCEQADNRTAWFSRNNITQQYNPFKIDIDIVAAAVTHLLFIRLKHFWNLMKCQVWIKNVWVSDQTCHLTAFNRPVIALDQFIVLFLN